MKKKRFEEEEMDLTDWDKPLCNKDSIEYLKKNYRIKFKGWSWMLWGHKKVEIWAKQTRDFGKPYFSYEGIMLYNPRTDVSTPTYNFANIDLNSYISYLYKTKIKGEKIDLK